MNNGLKNLLNKFIKKAVEIHGNKYDYSKVVYVNNKTKVIIGCPIHGFFEQTPHNHFLSKIGCKKCSYENISKKYILSTKKFIKKAVEIHGDRYDYSKVVYVNNKTKVIIGCPIHGFFEQIAGYHYISKTGCKKCSYENIDKSFKRITKKQFIKKAVKIHENKYDYSKVNFIDYKTKVIIGCPIHGDFEQTPQGHLQNNGCPKCGRINANKKINLTTKKFIKKAVEIHGDRYDYSKVNYIHSKKPVIIICYIHGDFKQTPTIHNEKKGCPKCSCFGYSRKAITWLEEIAEKENIYIQHAENIGEYQISGTRYKADGFCKETNTIYEFYGDIWHGNLNLFEEDEQCHPYTNESAGNLYKKTKKREQEIIDLGYKIISIWENDFK